MDWLTVISEGDFTVSESLYIAQRPNKRTSHIAVGELNSDLRADCAIRSEYGITGFINAPNGFHQSFVETSQTSTIHLRKKHCFNQLIYIVTKIRTGLPEITYYGIIL